MKLWVDEAWTFASRFSNETCLSWTFVSRTRGFVYVEAWAFVFGISDLVYVKAWALVYGVKF